MTAGDKVLLDWPAPGIARLRINRPDKRNAIDFDVRHQFIESLTPLLDQGDMRALVLGGVGGQFSAGGDLPSMVGLSEAQARARMSHVASVCRLVAGLAIPVVTAMEGASAGGCIGLALLGDLIVVGHGTRITFPFARLGLVPDWGSLYTLPRRVGQSAARRLFLAQSALSGADAHQLGLADELVDDLDVMSIAVRRAAELAALPAGAFARLKHRLEQPASTLDEALQGEVDDQTTLLCSEDFRKAYTAFTERRGRPVRPADEST